MKRVSKGFLLVAGVYSAIQYAISAVLTFVFSYAMLASGLSLFISGLINYQNAINSGYVGTDALNAYQSMMIAGGSILVSMVIFGVIMMVVNAFLLLAALWSLLNMAVLPDKKVPYIISIVIGVLTLLGANFLVGLLMILGGVFGMIAVKKEKKAQLEIEEAK